MLLSSVESKFSQEGLIRRRTEVVFNDRCQAGFDPSGLQTDAIDMPSRNGAHQDVHASWEDSSDSHPSVARPQRHKKKHCSPFMRHPEVVSGRRENLQRLKRVNQLTGRAQHI